MIDRALKATVKRLNYFEEMFEYRKHKQDVNQRFSDLKGKVAGGDQCLIVGNGPSIKDTDFSKYEGCKVITMNRAYVKWSDLGIEPFAHVCINRLVLDSFADDLLGLDCPTFLNYSAIKGKVFGDHVVPLLLGYFIGDRVVDSIDKVFSSGGTVTFVSLNLAILLGFKEIRLVGVDHNFFDKGPANKTVTMTKEDSNHFFDSYFPKGMKWELPDLKRSEMAYKVIREYSDSKGIDIFDETVGGKLSVFRKR